MAQLDARRLYASSTVLTQEQLDAFVNDFETFLNLIKLNDDNIQDASIDADDKIIDETITTSKFVNSSVTSAKIPSDAVTTIKIEDEAISSAKILAANITPAKIVAEAITTDKIAAAAVTKAKMTSNLVVSSAINDTTTGSAHSPITKYPITNGTVTITTEGNPIIIGFKSDGGSNGAYLSYVTDCVDGNDIYIGVSLYKGSGTADADYLTTFRWGYAGQNANVSAPFSGIIKTLSIPIGDASFVYEAAAGTHTITAYVRINAKNNSPLALTGPLETVGIKTAKIVGRLFAFEVT